MLCSHSPEHPWLGDDAEPANVLEHSNSGRAHCSPSPGPPGKGPKFWDIVSSLAYTPDKEQVWP